MPSLWTKYPQVWWDWSSMCCRTWTIRLPYSWSEQIHNWVLGLKIKNNPYLIHLTHFNHTGVPLSAPSEKFSLHHKLITILYSMINPTSLHIKGDKLHLEIKFIIFCMLSMGEHTLRSGSSGLLLTSWSKKFSILEANLIKLSVKLLNNITRPRETFYHLNRLLWNKGTIKSKSVGGNGSIMITIVLGMTELDQKNTDSVL